MCQPQGEAKNEKNDSISIALLRLRDAVRSVGRGYVRGRAPECDLQPLPNGGWVLTAVRQLDPELRAAILVLREGEHARVSTVRMLEIADRARAIGDYFNAGAAFEIADSSLRGFLKSRRQGRKQPRPP